MEKRSPYSLAKHIDSQLNRLLRSIDLQNLDRKEKNSLGQLQQEMSDVKTYSRSYELSETRQEQVESAARAKNHLETIRKVVLKASESYLFSPADVAQITAEVDQLSADLR